MNANPLWTERHLPPIEDDGAPPPWERPDEGDPGYVPDAEPGGSNGGRGRRMTRARLLESMADLRVQLRHDAFANRSEFRRGAGEWQQLDDPARRRLWTDAEAVLDFLPTKSTFDELVIDEAARNSFDPLADYMNSLRWDGTPRIDRLLTGYFGAADTELHREFGRRFAIGAARRALKPGSKHDTMLVLEGPQGGFKSTAVRTLSPNEEWFTDCLKLDADPREVVETTAGKFIGEVAELGGLRKADVDNLKALLSRQSDRARAAYGRTVSETPRRFVLVGTINPGSSGYLVDETGNRRFWPVRVGRIDVAAIRRDRDQIWAEAVAAHKAGEPNWLSAHVTADAEAAQRDRAEEPAWAEVLAEHLATVSELSTNRALEMIGVPTDRRDKRAEMQVAAALKALGWERAPRRNPTGPRVWRRAQ